MDKKTMNKRLLGRLGKGQAWSQGLMGRILRNWTASLECGRFSTLTSKEKLLWLRW